MAGGSRELKVIISGDSKGLSKAFKNSADSASKFGSGLKKVGLIAGAAAVGGIAAVAVGLKKSIDAAKEAEVSQKKLQTQLKALDISYAQHGDTIDKTLQKQSALSAFDDEDLADSFTNLVRLTGDVNKALDLNALAADIARGKGIDLAGATSIVTKAQMGNIGALKRQGIEIDKVTTHQDALGKGASDSAKEQAKALDLTATKQQAVALLQEKFAGQAKAYGETAAGAQERLGVAFENLGEVIGSKVLPHLVPVVQGITDFINKVAESERLGQILTSVGGVITTAIEGIRAAFQVLAEKAEEYWPRIQAAAAKVSNWYKNNLEPTIISVSENISDAWKKSGEGSEKTTRDTFGKIPPFMLAIMSANLRIINAALAALRGDWDEAWKQISGIPRVLLVGMANQLKFLGGALKAVMTAAANAAFTAFTGAMRSWFGKISALMASLPGKMRAALGDLGSLLYAAGVAVLQGFYNGLVAKFEAIKNFISGIAVWIESHKGPRSADLMLLNTAGRLIIQGLQDGMQAQWVRLQAMVDGLSDDLAQRYGRVVDAAIEMVTSKQSALEAAFDALSSVALEAFDKMGDKFKTKSEKALEKFDIEQQMKEKADRIQQLADDIKKAQDELNQFVAAGPEQLTQGANEDPAEFAKRQEDARKQFEDRRLALQAGVATAETALAEEQEAQRLAARRAALEKQAEQERTAHDDRRALQRRHFEEQMTDLRGDLLSGEITRKEYNQRLVRLYKRFGIPMKERGKALGLALAEGLNEAQVNVTGAAQALMQAIKDQLERMELVINVLIRDAGKGQKADKRALGGPVRKGQPYLVGERGPELFIPGQAGKISPNASATSGGGGTYVFNFPNYVGDRRDLERQMQQVMRRFEDSNGISFTGRSL